MAKKIDWLDNFAESMAKQTKMSKVASKSDDVIVDKESVGNAKLGEQINYNGKLYKVADLEYEDEKGPGVVLTEVSEDIDTTDPMSVSMGANAGNYGSGQKPQEYSRTNPGDVYHYEVPETFEQAALDTAQQIETERNFDRSTVPGHYTTPKDMTGVTPMVEETTPEIVEEVAETPIEDILETPEETEEIEKIEASIDTEDLDEENEKPVVGRYNRILKRIMASK
jgi:hypothetical protein